LDDVLDQIENTYFNGVSKVREFASFGEAAIPRTITYMLYRSLKKVGVEFLGIESKNKKDDIIFPRLKSLLFQFLDNLEEWIGFEGMREEEDNGITIIMPRLQQLQI
jgi:hypothetical protein